MLFQKSLALEASFPEPALAAILAVCLTRKWFVQGFDARQNGIAHFYFPA
jgi:hypothetical protein